MEKTPAGTQKRVQGPKSFNNGTGTNVDMVKGRGRQEKGTLYLLTKILFNVGVEKESTFFGVETQGGFS